MAIRIPVSTFKYAEMRIHFKSNYMLYIQLYFTIEISSQIYVINKYYLEFFCMQIKVSDYFHQNLNGTQEGYVYNIMYIN